MTISDSTTRLRALPHFLALLLFAACTFSLCALPASAQKPDGAGVVLSAEASAKDVGLPLYPGSQRHKDKNDDSAGANLGLWGGGSGFKMVVLKMESADSADKVADFYKKALAKYGNVLDCSNPATTKKNEAAKGDSKALSCGDDKPENNGKLFKAGTKEQQHIVGIEANDSGTLYQIVYLTVWSDNKKK